ncbi:MAG: helix-turn-helix domain-containing protein [Actinomycetota bacterium]|nr:helix-turn-helix domain-containing protein [Actinomycetota bacterium]
MRLDDDDVTRSGRVWIECLMCGAVIGWRAGGGSALGVRGQSGVDEDRLLSKAEVASRLGVKPYAVGLMIRRGELAGHKVRGKELFVRERDVAAYRK